MILVSVLAGLLLDHKLGEPSRWHPLVGFGRFSHWLERHFNPNVNPKGCEVAGQPVRNVLKGTLAWCCAVLPFAFLAYELSCFLADVSPVLSWLVDVLLLYFALGLKSLKEHVRDIYRVLVRQDLDGARGALARIVSRDTELMSDTEVRKAAIESSLENGADAVFAPIFWFLVAGGVGVLIYRLANTLDAMWGYRNLRFEYFGKFAARVDDVLNFVPARLTALAYLLSGQVFAWRTATTQAKGCASINAGLVMASGAISLDVSLGGAAKYDGVMQTKPTLGSERAPSNVDVLRSLRLLDHALIVWCGIILVLGALGFSSMSAATEASDRPRDHVAVISAIDYMGRLVTLKQPAQRIVALAPHIVENIYSAGAGGKIVGAVDYCDYPEEANNIPRVGGIGSFSVEAIVALQPDLVVVWRSGKSTSVIDKLTSLGLNVYVSDPHTLDHVPKSIRDFGRLAGTGEIAEVNATAFELRQQQLVRRFAYLRKVGMLYQVWNEPLQTLNDQHIISDVMRLCGGRNVFGESLSLAPKISLESVIARDPEVIVASGMGQERPDWLNDWVKWTSLKAVELNNLYYIPPDIIQRHTVRLLDGAARLCDQLALARGKAVLPQRLSVPADMSVQ